MREYTTDFVNSHVSDQDVYDVYWFWPSRNVLQLPTRDEFIHSRIPYTKSPQDPDPHSALNATSSGCRRDMESFGYSKLYSAGFFLTINQKLDRFVEKVRARM